MAALRHDTTAIPVLPAERSNDRAHEPVHGHDYAKRHQEPSECGAWTARGTGEGSRAGHLFLARLGHPGPRGKTVHVFTTASSIQDGTERVATLAAISGTASTSSRGVAFFRSGTSARTVSFLSNGRGSRYARVSAL